MSTVLFSVSVCFVGKKIEKSRTSTQKRLVLDNTCYCYIMSLTAAQVKLVGGDTWFVH